MIITSCLDHSITKALQIVQEVRTWQERVFRKGRHDRLADLAQELHVALYTVRSREQGKSSLSREMPVQICLLYQVSSDCLLGLSDYDPLPYCLAQLAEHNHNIKENGMTRRSCRPVKRRY